MQLSTTKTELAKAKVSIDEKLAENENLTDENDQFKQKVAELK